MFGLSEKLFFSGMLFSLVVALLQGLEIKMNNAWKWAIGFVAFCLFFASVWTA